MKRSAFIAVASMAIIGIFPSCEKTNQSTVRTYVPTPVPAQTTVLNVVARDWMKDNDGNYTSRLIGILNHVPGASTQVYAKAGDQNLLISSGGIIFMNGHLRSELDGVDIKLVFKYFGTDLKIPFTTLDVKVVFSK